MRAAIFRASGRPLSIEQVPDPRPASDQIIVEVARSGICGSDLHVTEHGVIPPGVILGHEFAGTIVELGSKVAGDWRVGDRVTALPVQACRECDACAAGLPALCRSGRFTGMTLEYPGAYAQYTAARASMLQRLPTGVAFTVGALVEPLAVAHHAVELARIAPGDSVLVIGAGPIGAGVTLFARLAGARHVLVSEPAAARREIAAALGATALIDPASEDVAARCAALSGAPPQVVIECVGNPGLLQQALELAGIRGRVVIAGVCFAEDRIVPVVALMKEVSVQFSQCYTERNFEAVITAIARGEARPAPMHSQTIGLGELPERFEALRRSPRDCKVLIDPQRP
ncbi:MAG TPA: alcohol dehydrogenase catalytic domain-containing protein [Steroidobacteraceae bacterium]|jgi:(R,R)-butanediol dehydrogenase/meso-butanediol dehydrogenase/diacetyl reductase